MCGHPWLQTVWELIRTCVDVCCRCYQDYFGERCGEQFMKTQRKNDVADYSKTVFVVVAVLLSSISFVAVLIIVIVQ